MRATACRLALLVLLGVPSPALARDRDGDGLSDFHEVHKYLTDPGKKDTDGDGIPDGNWHERREYQYTVRSVVQVMRPVTPESLTDDYQDARVLDETEDYVELEVIHYPFNTVEEAIEGSAGWRKDARAMERWLERGPTADWTPELRREIHAALRRDGIDVDRLDDVTLVRKASQWLLDRAEYHDGFSTFITAFDEKGRPFVPDELREGAERGKAEKGLALEEQWRREISAAGMFATGARGSCTSSAIYLNGCMRAVGIPTRIVLCIPVIDASDGRELDMVRQGIRHPEVRRILLSALEPLGGSWSSHTLNEVWVGGRWRRLNYSRLGQNILDKGMFGLMTHVATFDDWADARMPETVGRRQTLSLRDHVFTGSNPYSCISLRDARGEHCTLPVPDEDPGFATAALTGSITIEGVHWMDAAELPGDIQEWAEKREVFGLVAQVTGMDDSSALRSFLTVADTRVFLEADGHPTLKIGFDPGCWWFKNDAAWIFVPFGPADRRDHVAGSPYRFRSRNESEKCSWEVGEGVLVAAR